MSAFAIQMGGRMSDVELMNGLKGGDEDYLEPLLRRHRPALTNYIFHFVRNSAAAEELAQDVFFSVYRARERYEPSANFTTWLYAIARNRSMNWVRDNRRHLVSGQFDMIVLRQPAAGGTPEQQLLRRAASKRVREAVAALPQRQRAAVEMHKFSGMEYSEIAREFNCSLTAVKALLNRAYASLRRSLSEIRTEPSAQAA